MRRLLLPASLVPLLLAGCAHAPPKAPAQAAAPAPAVAAPPAAAVEPLAPAVAPLSLDFGCMPPALYATMMIDGGAPDAQRRSQELEDYAHAFMNVKMLDEYKKCLDEHPDLPDGGKKRAEEASWRASSQPEFRRLDAMFPDGEKIADAKDEYADVDAAHTRLRILITRRDGKSLVVERTFEKPPQR